jgi:hypothetical protein
MTTTLTCFLSLTHETTSDLRTSQGELDVGRTEDPIWQVVVLQTLYKANRRSNADKSHHSGPVASRRAESSSSSLPVIDIYTYFGAIADWNVRMEDPNSSMAIAGYNNLAGWCHRSPLICGMLLSTSKCHFHWIIQRMASGVSHRNKRQNNVTRPPKIDIYFVHAHKHNNNPPNEPYRLTTNWYPIRTDFEKFSFSFYKDRVLK